MIVPDGGLRVLPAVIPLAVVEIDEPEPLDLDAQGPDLVRPAVDDVLERRRQLGVGRVLFRDPTQLFRKRLGAKHGVIGLTRAAALDYAAQNLRVNAVCPGYIDTPMMDRFTGGTAEGRARVIAEEPVGRMGKPEEIAAAVVWLCSDAAAFVVGHAMVIDGGQTV